MGLPFERLRSLARWGQADDALLAEIAGCLGDFDDDPAGLVVACRQLVAHHRDWAPLWWLCSRVLVAADPTAAAHAAVGEIASDRTSASLVSALPFPSDDPVLVLGWPPCADLLLEDRPDLDLVSLRLDPLSESDAAPVTEVDRFEVEDLAPSHVLLAPWACAPGEALVAFETRACVDAVPARARIWAVAPTGTLLPQPLFDAFALAADSRQQWSERLDIQGFDRIITGHGMVGAASVAERIDTAVAPELLRPLV